MLNKGIQTIYVDSNSISLKDYKETREAMDVVWDFGEEILGGYKRYSKLPIEELLGGFESTRGFGHASISTEARITYEKTLEKWERFKSSSRKLSHFYSNE